MTTDGDGTGDGIEGGSGSRPGDEGLASAGWIAGSVVSLLIGWSLALASILSTSGPSSSRWSGGGMLLLDAIAAALGLGVPILCLVSMRRAERRGSAVGAAAPGVCALVLVLAVCTLLPMLVLQAAQVAIDAA